ncbi:MAG: hypothetical protein JO040_02325, partial [Gemmatimonadetes bacterium]|nr:hypothetical protein [Gemmatimonadota bacterium]
MSLDQAVRIGEALCGEGAPAAGGWALADGSAGTGLFLAELCRIAPCARLRRGAAAALERAVAGAERGGLSGGFYAGRVGVAYAAARGGTLLGREELLGAARRLLLPTPGKADAGLDLYSGAAGAVPVLLHLAELLGEDALRGRAVGLGERIVAAARREPYGWSWPNPRVPAVRGPTGLAHGASGMGHALLALARATGDGAWLYGARQAFLYERSFFRPEAGGWLDLRTIPGGGEPYPGRVSAGWRHGTAGIGLARAHAFRVLGDRVLREEALAAAQAVAGRFPRGDDLSPDHGAAADGELLLYAAGVLERPEWRERVEAAVEEGWGRRACGSPSPGLLAGAAGVGHLFLRMADPGVPPFLLPGELAPDGVTPEPCDAARREHVRVFFGDALDRLERLRERGVLAHSAALPPPPAPAPHAPTPPEPAPVAAYRALRRWAVALPPAERGVGEDALALPLARFELLLGPVDLAREAREQRLRADVRAVRWGPDTLVSRAPRARLVETARAWEGWPGGAAPLP